MKKRIGFIAAVITAALLTGCAAEEKKNEIPNPMTEVEGSQAFEAVNANIEVPAGAENAKYYIIDKETAEIQFDLNGASYSYRASGLRDDISGVYMDMKEGKEIEVNVAGEDVDIETTQEGGRLAEWDWDPVEYSLYTADTVEDAVIKALVKELALATSNVIHMEK